MKNYREKIDKIDSELIKLLIERFETTHKIGEIKMKENLPIYNEKRELEIYEKLSDLLSNNDDKDYIIEVFRSIIESSKKQQETV